MQYDKNLERHVNSLNSRVLSNMALDEVAVLTSSDIEETYANRTIVVRGRCSPNIEILSRMSFGGSFANVCIFVEEDASPIIRCSAVVNLYIFARGNSRVTVQTSNCSPNIEIEDNAKVWGYEGGCGVFRFPLKAAKGVITNISNPREWCEFYNVPVVDGIALLAKGVLGQYESANFNNITKNYVYYTPGTIPVAEDWDGGFYECGKGLHFSPNINMVRHFISPTHLLICPVHLEDMVIHPMGQYLYKCKAKGCCEPVWEVDNSGFPVNQESLEIRDAFFKKHS